MEERIEGIMHGFSCATKVCVLVGLFLLGSLSREDELYVAIELEQCVDDVTVSTWIYFFVLKR